MASSLVIDTKKGNDETMNNPYVNRTPKLTLYEILKMTIMTILFIPVLRVLIILIFLLISWFYIKFMLIGYSFPKKGENRKPYGRIRLFLLYPAILLTRACLFVAGFYWISVKYPPKEVRNKQPRGEIIVANHSSFIDAAFFSTQGFYTAVMKKEVSIAPLMGSISQVMQPITIDRSSGDGFQEALVEISRRAKLGTFPPIMIFPEGTTSNQFSLTSFKKGAFTPGVPVQPVILRYPFCHLDLSWGPLTSTTFLFYRMLCQVYNTVTAEYLPVYVPSDIEKNNPIVFAENVRQVMSQAMGLGHNISNHDLHDTMLIRRASFNTKQYLSHHVIPEVEMNTLKYNFGLSYENVEALLDKFKQIDKDDVGKINFADLCKILETEPTSRYANTIYEIIRHDNNGSKEKSDISFRDLCYGLSLLSQSDSKQYEKSKLLFSIYDAKGNGYVVEDDISSVIMFAYGMTSAANSMPIIRAIYKKMEVVDGKMTFDVFLKTIEHCPGLVMAAKKLLTEKPMALTPKLLDKFNKQKIKDAKKKNKKSDFHRASVVEHVVVIESSKSVAIEEKKIDFILQVDFPIE